mgnify:CR=1 FL=1
MNNKTLVVLTGPQGSGNHLWSKILSLHQDVFGWKTLLNNYWEAHRFSEPFAEYWRDPTLLHKFDWSQSQYFFTSISIPLGIQSKGTKWCPNVVQFCTSAQSLGLTTKILVVRPNDWALVQNCTTFGHHFVPLLCMPSGILIEVKKYWLCDQSNLCSRVGSLQYSAKGSLKRCASQ